MTCKHVIEEIEDRISIVEMREEEEKPVLTPIHEIKISKKYDLAILKTTKDPFPENEIYEDTLCLGLESKLLGCTTTYSPTLLEPRVLISHLVRIGGDSSKLEFLGLRSLNELDVSIPKEFSGGPIYRTSIIKKPPTLIGISCTTSQSKIELNKEFFRTEIIPTGGKGNSIEIIKEYEVVHYGLMHSISDLKELINEIEEN